jgi:hypothetical protein
MDGCQVFVRHDDVEAVERSIRAYVEVHGCDAVVDPDADEASPNLARRERRTFVLSPPRDGVIVVWEDGSWSDRRMAGFLSQVLGTEAVWLMLSEVTDSWAYARYRHGRPVDRRHQRADDPLEVAERFARDQGLPFALEYLGDPEEDAKVDWLVAELERMEQAGDLGDEPPVEQLRAESRHAEVVPEPAVEIDVEDDEGQDGVPPRTAGEVERVRSELREFAVPCRDRRRTT